MCLSFPGRVVAIDELGAAVDMEGRLRRALTTFAPETQVGDWVLVSAGSIVQRLDPTDAADVCNALREAHRLGAGGPGREERYTPPQPATGESDALT
jgi:hydrogenase assembly chaperone HypC/HupF